MVASLFSQQMQGASAFFAVLSAAGTLYSVARIVLASDNTPYTVPQAVLASNGTSYNVI